MSSCIDCSYCATDTEESDLHTIGNRHCIKHPPQCVVIKDTLYSVFPAVSSTRMCGEFRNKITKETIA